MSYMDLPATSADQRFLFSSSNDKELAIAKSLRHRGQRYMLVVLLAISKPSRWC